MSRLNWRVVLILSLLANLLLGSLITYKYLRRFHRGDWVVLQSNLMRQVSNQSVFFLGDSQVDNFCTLLSLPESVVCVSVPGIQVRELGKLVGDLKPSPLPSRILLLIGINDLRYGRSIDQILMDQEILLDSCLNRYPNGLLHLVSILPIVEDLDINGAVSNEQIEELNRRLKTLADRRGATYIDAFSTLKRHGQLPAELTSDGLHLNLTGQQYLYRILHGYFSDAP